MAKTTNGVGVMSGKAGAFVYQPNKGDKKYPQIVRAYQPNVANPKTPAQTAQRSKMNVAGQISSLASNGVLTGFGGRARENRSMFVSHLLKVAQVVNDQTGVYVPDMRFSDSRVIPFTATANLSASVSGGLYGSIDLEGAKIGDGVRVIVVVTFKTPGVYGYDSVTYYDYVKRDDGDRIIVSQPISVSSTAAQGAVSVYAFMVPFTLDENATTVQYGKISAAINSGALEGDRIVAEVTRLTGSGVGVSFGQTICVNEDGYTIQQNPSPIVPLPDQTSAVLGFSEDPAGTVATITVNDAPVNPGETSVYDANENLTVTVNLTSGNILKRVYDATTGETVYEEISEPVSTFTFEYTPKLGVNSLVIESIPE